MPKSAWKTLGICVIAALVGAALAPAATPLVVRSSGEIRALTPKRIMVGRVHCSIVSAPTRAIAAQLVVGYPAKITCRGGVLTKITPIPLPPIIGKTSPPTSFTAGPGTSSLILNGPIGGLSATTIVFGPSLPTASNPSLSCAVGVGSPDLTGYAVGNIVTATCTNGVLDSIKRTS